MNHAVKDSQPNLLFFWYYNGPFIICWILQHTDQCNYRLCLHVYDSFKNLVPFETFRYPAGCDGLELEGLVLGFSFTDAISPSSLSS